MKPDLKNIQDLINDKADKKLEAAVRALEMNIYNGEPYEMLKGLSVNIGTEDKPKKIGLSFIFSSDGFRKQIIENNTERYRDIEAKLFLSKVESLREDVDHLLDNIQ